MKNCFDWISKRKAYKMTGISADDIRKRVARKLGDAAEEEERTRIRMKKRLILSVVVAALLLVTAAAAGSGYLKAFFPTGISVFEKNVKTEPITGKIGDWEITVLASLTDDNGTYLNMSLKATGETAAKLSAMSSIHEVSEVIPDPLVYLEGEDEELESWPESDWDTDSPEWKTNPVISCSTQVIYETPENKPLVLKLGDFGSRDRKSVV